MSTIDARAGKAREVALLASPLSPHLDRELSTRFEVHHWPDISDQDAWLKARGTDVTIVVTGASSGLPVDLIRNLPALRIIAIFGVGFDKVDLEEARRRGIRVTNTPDVLTDDVADLALGLTLSLLRDLPAADHYVKSGAWPTGAMPLGRKASGRQVGIVGLGRIGKAIAARFAVLGPVSYTGTHRQAVPYRFFPSVVELARACSILVIAASANAASRHLIGREVLDALGPQGYLVNIARGSLVDEAELIAALREKRIAGAALDVFEDEPRVPDGLRALSNVVLTPHIGSATEETRNDMARAVLANLDAFLAGVELPSALT